MDIFFNINTCSKRTPNDFLHRTTRWMKPFYRFVLASRDFAIIIWNSAHSTALCVLLVCKCRLPQHASFTLPVLTLRADACRRCLPSYLESLPACDGPYGRSVGIIQWQGSGLIIGRSRVQSPGGAAGKLTSLELTFFSRPLYRYPFHPRVTAAGREGSQSLCQIKCRWQVTLKHPYTRDPTKTE